MTIKQVKYLDKTLIEEMNKLLLQLSDSAKKLSESELKTIIDSDTTDLLIAMNKGRICGMLTLVIFRIPTGIRALIEDVVVNEADRGEGCGKLLLETAIGLARSKGVKILNLTSNPGREAANQLYQKIGFEKRDANSYKFNL